MTPTPIVAEALARLRALDAVMNDEAKPDYVRTIAAQEMGALTHRVVLRLAEALVEAHDTCHLELECERCASLFQRMDGALHALAQAVEEVTEA